MSNSRISNTLISHEALKSRVSLSSSAEKTVRVATARSNDIIQIPLDNKKLLIVGPCSADFEDSLLQYGEFIAKMREKYGDSGLEIIMRYYTGKPRTIGGWKGLANSNPGEEADTNKGIEESRRIAVKLLEMGVPLADEMLHPQLIRHFDDIYSYLAVGARSTENQYHREVASGLDIPVGMKNPTSGDLDIMLNSIQAGQSPSHYTIGNDVMNSTGNGSVHGVLRGGLTPNYDTESLKKLKELITKRGGKITNPGVIIDASHDNSKGPDGKKDPMRQPEIISQVINSRANDLVRGYMIESYIHTGRQDYGTNAKHGLSLTDACLGLDETEKLIQKIAHSLY